jgi:peroxiredoxin
MKSDFVKLLLTGFLIIGLHAYVKAANRPPDGYEIKIKLTEYNKDTLLLGYQLGDKSYIKDTAVLDKSTGFFTFKGSTKLQPGVYLVVMPPENNYFQIMISDKEQHFTLTTSTQEYYKDAKVKNSTDNEVFISYMNYLSEKRKEAEGIQAMKAKDSVDTQKKLENLDKDVKTYQFELAKKHAGTVAAMLIKSAVEIEMPNFDHIKDATEKQLANYYYYKQHYFDNFDMPNPAMLRSPVLFQRIDYYINKLTPGHPDSIILSLDRVMQMIKPSKETFQFYFVHYLNEYAKSKLVGYDAIYVHLAKKYIETGQTDEFIEKENKDKIITNANKLFPILIGKTAPNIEVFKEDNSKVSLYGMKSKYKVLFIFDPECGHCQKQSPKLVEFFQKAKDKKWDVKVMTVCTKIGDKVGDCWKYAKEKGFGDLINTVDPYIISRYKTLYNVETTPQVFVIDDQNIIRSKGIEASQLEEVLDYIIQDDNAKLKKEVKAGQ